MREKKQKSENLTEVRHKEEERERNEDDKEDYYFNRNERNKDRSIDPSFRL